ncbi:MAG: outer membrane protein assembly factor BamA [Spirochaetes bacterium]|nr:outer membrane protein assembly factor BamA [Spirochaetota bacterium]
MRLFTLSFIVFFTLTAAVYAQNNAQDEEWFQGRPIRDIVFTGLRNVSSSELDGLMNPFRGGVFTDDLFWEIQGRLWALEYFDMISPNVLSADALGTEVVIRFDVVERPVVVRINFTGNSNIRRAELLNVLSTRVNDVINNPRIRADELAITERYLEAGFPDVQVTSSIMRAGNDGMVIAFHITEGEMISISEIRFEGNYAFSDRVLRNQLSLRPRGIFNNGAFQEARLIADWQAIEMHYRDRGFIDAAVLDVTRELERDERGNNNLILTFSVMEGRQFTFGGINFYGNEIFSEPQLQDLVASRPGEILNARRVENDLQRVADLYFEHGYIFNTIAHVENRNESSGVVYFDIHIVERGRAHIEHIIVRGNDRTRTDVILREIPLVPGEVFSRARIMDAMRNLHNTQFFSVVIPETPMGSTDNLMDLVFIVEEQPTMDIQFGLTFSGSADPDHFPVSGLIQWSDRNFLGTGNQLGISLSSSIVHTTSFSVNYMHRWVFGLPLSAGVDFSVHHVQRLATTDNMARFHGDETGAFPDGFQSYSEFVQGSRLPPRDFLMEYNQLFMSVGLSSGYRWGTLAGNLTLSGGVRVGMIQNSFDADLFRPFDPVLRDRHNQFVPRNLFWTSVSLDQRDIFFDPTRGYLALQRFTWHGVFEGEREHFIRSDTTIENYITLFNVPVTEGWSFRGVLAMHSTLSFIFRQPGRDRDQNIPTMQDVNKLAVDGMFVGRGWTDEFHNRGLALWSNWVELRFPVVPGLLAFDLFFDAAGVETAWGYYFGRHPDGGRNFTWENMRFSYGFGFRFTMPQFPFRFMLANRFRIVDGQVQWQTGAFGGNPADNPHSFRGMDPVISFTLTL